jgi:hypothetical protein
MGCNPQTDGKDRWTICYSVPTPGSFDGCLPTMNANKISYRLGVAK